MREGRAGSESSPSRSRLHSRWSLLRMCCGLFGVQIVWGLQNVNTSRIFQTFGAKIAELPLLWIAAPITGLLVQPIIGHLSDRTWGPLGRRRPYLLAGALVSALSLLLMPNVGTLWAASLMLWILTAGINIAMEPFRALVADVVPAEQRNVAFAMQVALIGAGAVFASALPWILSSWFGLASEAAPGVLPLSVRAAFYIGAAGLLVTVFVTVLSTSESRTLAAAERGKKMGSQRAAPAPLLVRSGGVCIAFGAAIGIATVVADQGAELYLLAAIGILIGLAQWLAAWKGRNGNVRQGLLEIVDDVVLMPPLMRRLALVQFFTWFGLFAMWIYAVPAVAGHGGAIDPSGAAYNKAADRVGLVFAFYNAVAILGSLVVPGLSRRFGLRSVFAVCLMLGATGLAGLGTTGTGALLFVPGIGLGIAWSAILSIPYALVAKAVPPERVGVYMGIHNVFLVLPQLVATATLGWFVDHLLGGSAAKALMVAAGSIVIAAACALTLPDEA